MQEDSRDSEQHQQQHDHAEHDRARRAGGPAKCLEFGTRPY